MRIIGFLLVVVGLMGFAIGGMMFGDIGIAAMLGATIALLAGIGFWRLPGFVKKVAQAQRADI